MTKLLDPAQGAAPVGRAGLEEFCDQLNARRAQLNVAPRYYLGMVGGVLTLQDEAQGTR